MYRLICISGQNSARSFILKEGDNVVGRMDDADIKISSNGVSKKHAVINVKGNTVHVTDLGSKNGTFVNGVMVKKKELNSGDKVAIHDHVYQIVKGEIKIEELSSFSASDLQQGGEDSDYEYRGKPRAKVQGIKGSIDQFIESTVMPFFEEISKRYSISVIISVVLISCIIAITLIVTVPVVQFDSMILDKEAAQRAVYLSNLLAEENKNTVGTEGEEVPSVKAAEDVPGVVWSAVADIGGRVLAPAERAGDQLPGVVMDRIKEILKGTISLKEDTVKIGANVYKRSADVYSIGSGRYIVTSPIKVYSEQEGQNVVIGFATLEFATSGLQNSLAGAWQRILVGMAIACFIGLMISIFFSRLFILPFVRIYDELDLALKGEAKRVSYSFGTREGMDLIELLNILIRKSRRASAKVVYDNVPESLHDLHSSIDNVLIFDSVGRALKVPFFVLDTSNSIVSANQAFSSITNYKATDWHSVPVVDAIKEQRILGVILSLIARFDEMGQDLSEEVIVNEKVYRIGVSGVKNDRGEFTYHCISVEMV